MLAREAGQEDLNQLRMNECYGLMEGKAGVKKRRVITVLFLLYKHDYRPFGAGGWQGV